MCFERHEIGERFEPKAVDSTKVSERAETGKMVDTEGGEAIGRMGERGQKVRVETAVVGAGGREGAQRGEFGGGDKAGGMEFAEVDEVGVAGAAREQLVGRIAVAGRADGADLPVAHAGGGQKIDKAACSGAEVSDAIVAGKRGDVGEDARAARGEPGGRLGSHGKKGGRVGRRPALGCVR